MRAGPLPALLKRILSEPLSHFLLLGVAIFGLYAWLGGDARDSDRRIVVSAGEVAQLADLFSMRWSRPPTPPELRGLLDARVREEVLYREALALGLDRDDTIVRRRLAQKMEFLIEDLGSRAQPGEEDLRVFLADHPDLFRERARLTVSQVYVSADRRGGEAEGVALRILATLREASHDGDPGTRGDVPPMAHSYTDVDHDEIAGIFGADFADSVAGLPPGAWYGPVRSGYGLHLVFVHGRSDSRLPELAEVEQKVRGEWRATRRREVNEASVAKLLEGYEVVIEERTLPSAFVSAVNESGP